MTRIRLSVAIIAILFLSCFGAVWGVGKAAGSLLTTLSMLETAVQTEDYARAAEIDRQLRDDWDTSAPWLRVAVSKGRIQELSDEISRLGPLIETESEELKAEIAVLKSRLQELEDAECPTVDRVF